MLLVLGLFSIILAAPPSIIPLYNAGDLQKMGDCLTCQYMLMADVALAELWAPIGTVAKPFTGTFNGNGKTVTFSTIGVTGDGNAGFFGAASNAKVYNLKLTSTTLLADLGGATTLAFGLLAGTIADTSVYGCSATLAGEVSIGGGTLTAGALLGTVRNSVIDRCFADSSLKVKIAQTLDMGGLIGYAAGTRVTGCEVRVASIVAEAPSVTIGGLAGVLDECTVADSIVQGAMSSYASSSREFIGGILGLTASSKASSIIQACMVDVVITSNASTNNTLGGVVSVCVSPFEIRGCMVILRAEGTNGGTSAGGLVGKARLAYTIDSCSVNATIRAEITTKSSRRLHLGGMVGSSSLKGPVISNSVAVVGLSMSAPLFNVGGIVASGREMAIARSGVHGTITGIPMGKPNVAVGGLFGYATSIDVGQCYFVGSVSVSQDSSLSVGALAAALITSTVRSSFVLANISATGKVLSVGGIGYANETAISSCYTVVNISASATSFLMLGGMAGLFGKGTVVKDSLAVGNLTATSSSGVAAGGFIGLSIFRTGEVSIVGSCAWATVSVDSSDPSKAALGGFAGSLNGTVGVSMSLAYASLTSKSADIVGGLFAGVAGTARAQPAGNLDHIIAYVTPGGTLTNVPLVAVGSTIGTADSYCAEYTGTQGCTASATLNTESFANTFGAAAVQVSASLANGSISLKTLPAPATGSSISTPRLVMPSPASAGAWPAEIWAVSERLFLGLPLLKAINYAQGCGWATGCHGVGSSPIDVTCSPGWASPAPNTTALVDSLNRCNTFACTGDADCGSGGTCSSVVCKCASGYTGADCSVQVCPVADGKVCGGSACTPFAATAITGICQCAPTEALTMEGLCTGCQGSGFGACQDARTFLCFAGYSTASGCLEYYCSAATTNICNGRGTCTNKKCACTSGSLLGGNCHTVCTADVTKDCFTFNCGPDNSCSSHGQCVPSLKDMTSSCFCNINEAGESTGTRYTGAFCDQCEVGYKMYQGSCFTDNCLQCDGGSCKPDVDSKTIMCACPEGQILKNGKCVTNLCGECAKGECITVQGTVSPTEHYCVCNSKFTDGSCYIVECSGCTNGFCKPDNKAMSITCVCSAGFVLNIDTGNCEILNKSNSALTIALPIVIVGCLVVATIVTVLILIKKHIIKMRPSKNVRALMPSGSEGLIDPSPPMN